MGKSLPRLALAVSAVLFSSACAPSMLYVRLGPPEPVVDARLAAPGPGYVWIPGFYRWDGGTYFWVTGHWALPPAHYRAWVPGHWVHHPRRGWHWSEGYWRR